MHKLLVPFDNSTHAQHALKHAIRLAKKAEPLELVLLHVHEPPIVYGEVSIYLDEEKARQMLRQYSERILQPAIDLANKIGVPFVSEILTGDVPTVIVECADRHGCDAIVMGTRGLSAIGNLVMGSVAIKVVHLTKLPVTLVK